MATTDFAKKYYEKMYSTDGTEIVKSSKDLLKEKEQLTENDIEFFERFSNFAFDEVVNLNKEPLVDDKTRFISILAVLMGCQGLDAFKEAIPSALNFSVTPAEIKEIVYQAVVYLGMGRVFPFIKAVNEVFEQLGVEQPADNRATTTMENRLEKGSQAQVDIFGEVMREFYKSGPENSKHINYWLAENCFGDYYTRKGMDLKTRELITFCYLYAQGGCESQAIAHASANMRLGNSREFLINVISQCIPYVGYPRTLNGLTCINKAAEQ